MRINLVVAILLLLCGAGVCAELQQAPTPLENTIQNKEANHNYQPTNKTTQNNPVFIKIVPTPKSNQETEAENKERNRKTSIETWTIGTSIVTAFILLIQTFVFGRQATRLKQTVESIEKTERPYLFVEKVRVRRRDPPSVPNSWYISFQFRNVGRMPAIVKECIVRIEDRDNISEIPDYAKAVQLTCKETVASNKAFTTSEIGPAPEIRVKNGDDPVLFVVFGKITYTELTGKTHHTGFAVEVSPHIPAFSNFNKEGYDKYD